MPGLGSPDRSGDATASDPCPCRGVLPEQICSLCLAGRSDAVLQCHEDTRPVTAAQGTGWWLWESLDLTSDLGQALTCRKDTASSYVNSCCRLCSPRPSASGCRQQGGRWPVGWGRLGGHLAMVSTVNTILHKSSLK